jgi:hypothetical protein
MLKWFLAGLAATVLFAAALFVVVLIMAAAVKFGLAILVVPVIAVILGVLTLFIHDNWWY